MIRSFWWSFPFKSGLIIFCGGYILQAVAICAFRGFLSSISVLYFNLGMGDDYLYYGATDFTGVNTGNPLIVRERTEFLDETLKKRFKFVEKHIFPEYYLIQVERYHDEVKKSIDEWIYMIKNNEIKEGSKSRNIDRAKEKLSELNMPPQERARYERYLINTAIERDVINTAKEEGRDEGEKLGLKKGRVDTAKNLLNLRVLSIEQISQVTGLAVEEIKKL